MIQDDMFTAASMTTAPQMFLPPSFIANFCLLTLGSSAILLKATGREMALGFLGPSFNLGCFFGQLGIVRIASCQRMSVCVIVILRLLNYL